MIVYKTTNLVNGKIYIGQTIRENTGYLGSGYYLRRAVKKYGKSNFKREVLARCSSQEELDEMEKFYIKEFDSTNRDVGYNIALGGTGSVLAAGYKHLISGENHYLKKMSSEEFQEWINNRTGTNNVMNKMSDDDKKKMFAKLSGDKHFLNKMDQQQREQFLEKQRGENHFSKKMSNEEYLRWKMSNGGENNYLKKLSGAALEKQRKLISENTRKQLLRQVMQRTFEYEIEINGEKTRKPTINECAKYLNIGCSTVHKIIKSPGSVNLDRIKHSTVKIFSLVIRIVDKLPN